MKTFICLLLLLCIHGQSTAQVSIPFTVSINLGPDSIAAPSTAFVIIERDTLNLAKLCAYANYFELSNQLLTKYNAVHSDRNALSFQAQVLYWMQDFDSSIALYEKALRLYPQPSYLHLDYARVLYGTNQYSKANLLLKTYRSIDSTNAEADIMTAYMHLWNGENKQAVQKANLLLKKFPGNAEAKDILGKVSAYTAPWCKTGIEFLSDDQPLKGKVVYAEGGVYQSWLFAPTVQIAYYQYRADSTSFHSSLVQVGNTLKYKRDNQLKIKAGVFRQNSKEAAFAGSIAYSRNFLRDFVLQGSLERRPYQYTISSLNNMVMEDVSAISIDYNRKNQWLGKAGYELISYEDGNKINSIYMWVLATVIDHPRYTIRGGYSFHYMDAIHNHFEPKAPIHELVNSQTFENLAGVYRPYFTPENQKVHNALARAIVHLNKKVQFTSRINVGIIAKSDNPHLWLDEPRGDYEVFTGYTQVNFVPVTWANELRFAASDKFSIAASYTYDKLLYYKNHRGGIELKYQFLK